MRDDGAGRLLDRLLETSGVVFGHARARHWNVDVAEPRRAGGFRFGCRAELVWVFAVRAVVDDSREPLPLKLLKIRKFRLWGDSELLCDCNRFHRESLTGINRITNYVKSEMKNCK